MPLFPACAPPVQGLPRPNPADSTPGLGLGSQGGRPGSGRPRAPCLPLTTAQALGEKQGNYRGVGVQSLALSSPTNPPPPSSFLPCRQLGWGGSRGWSKGRKPAQGQQETQEAVGRVGSRGLGYCSIFSGKKTGGKTEDGVPSPWGLRGIPLRLWQGVGVPRWLGHRSEAERWKMPPTTDESGWGDWQTPPWPLQPWQGLGHNLVLVFAAPGLPCPWSTHARRLKISTLAPPRAAHASPVTPPAPPALPLTL